MRLPLGARPSQVMAALAQGGMAFNPDGPSVGHSNSTQYSSKKCMSRTSPTSSSQQRISLADERVLFLATLKSASRIKDFAFPLLPRPNVTETRTPLLLLYCFVCRPSRTMTSNQQYSQPGPSVGADDATAECRRPPHWPRGACTCTQTPCTLSV